MLDKFGNIFLQSKLKKTKRNIVTANLNEVGSILFIINSEETNYKELIVKLNSLFINKLTLPTFLVFYKKKSKTDVREDEGNIIFLSQKDNNWSGLPAKKSVKKAIAKEYDLLLDFTENDNLSLKFITTLSKAKFKVGGSRVHLKTICDLTIDVKDNTAHFLAEQIKVYLEMLNK